MTTGFSLRVDYLDGFMVIEQFFSPDSLKCNHIPLIFCYYFSPLYFLCVPSTGVNRQNVVH